MASLGPERHSWDAKEWGHPCAAAPPILGDFPPFPAERTGRKMKRKVLRHGPDGSAQVWDESHDEFWKILGNESSISEGEMETSSEESPHRWHFGDSPCVTPGDFSTRASPVSQWGPPKSFIPPRFDSPAPRRGKTDPIAKYLEYKREWEKFPIPGEDPRNGLRWGVRERMIWHPPPPEKPRRPRGPNAYAVPTEKKRAALRWEVRWDLAQGLVPRKSTS
ncbi:centriolar and ciliogenesis-associated protein HYLS1 [Columba livia]|uniref:centriolar and ciliogenesis-associated protein HYLS1 n=1 Tax=Columba livia TaxID=8932 RepID=UPI0031BAEE6F